MASIAGVQDVGVALGACRGIGCNRLIVAVDRTALHDAESLISDRLERGRLEDIDPSEAWRILAQCDGKALERAPITLDLDDHGARRVADRAAEPETGREVPDERTEAHPLNHTMHCEPQPLTRATSGCIRIRCMGRDGLGRDAHRLTLRAGDPPSS